MAVSEQELELLRQVNQGEDVEDEALLAALEDTGLVGADGVHPLVLDLVATVTQPVLQALVEVSGPQGPTTATLAVRGETLWYTDPWPEADQAETVYHRDELTQLVFTLARLTGLRRHEVPAAARSFTAPLGAIDAVLSAMAVDGEAWDSVRTVATARFERFFTGMREEDAHLLMATLAHLRGAHRVTLAWGPAPEDCTGPAVWDCGDGGYWVRETPPEPVGREDVTPQTQATFRPVRAAEVWQLYARLLPSAQQLRDSVARSA